MMGGFGYDPGIIERFPSVRGSVIHATGLVNGPSSPQLRSAYEAEQEDTFEQIGDYTAVCDSQPGGVAGHLR